MKQRIEKLKKLINYHRYQVHVLNRYEISESALDSLKKELFDLEQKFPQFITPDSPTQRVEGKPLDKFEKVEHKHRMLSLNDAFDRQDMDNWQERIKKLLTSKQAENLSYFCMIKADGLAASLIYKNGIFIKGATRGDGRVGENVTNNLKTIETIPLKLTEPATCEVRGEVYISKKDFKSINKEQAKGSKELFANARNTAAGAIRQLDPKIAKLRKLSFVAWQFFSAKTKVEEYSNLKKLGFSTVDFKFCKDMEQVFDYFKEIGAKREKLSFNIDGLVVWVNDNEIFNKLGIVGKAPKGAIALKFPPEEAQTTVLGIKLQVGRTGAITPVAVLSPVKVGGATITRATLHNQDEIKRLGIKINDTVIVGRAGDVIPQIVKVLKELRTGKEQLFVMPKVCPVCGGKLAKKENEAILRCLNTNCSIRKKRGIYHFVSKQTFNIEGLGPKIIDQLLNEGIITDGADLFEIKQGDLLALERFGEKSADNLAQAISNKKSITLPRFIFSLGIRGVGEETALDLAEHFQDMKKLKTASIEQLSKIYDIGEETAKNIYHWFHNKNNTAFLLRLQKSGVKINYPLQTTNHKLQDKSFVLTGELVGLTRDGAKEKIRALGGNVSSSVSKKTDFVVAGNNPGSKYKKAQALGIKIITEKQFLKLLI